jgi:hypothetical protein
MKGVFVLVLSLLDHFGDVWIELLDSHAGRRKEKGVQFTYSNWCLSKRTSLGLRKAVPNQSIASWLVCSTMTDQCVLQEIWRGAGQLPRKP